MAAENRVQVVIGGRNYRLAGGDPDHTRRLARKVDETMARFSEGMVGVDDYQLAVLTALHIADELSAVEGDYRSYRSRVEALADRVLGKVEEDLDEAESEQVGGTSSSSPELASALSPSESEAKGPDSVAGS